VNTTRTSRSGFTLVELIVATAIFALVLSAAWSLFDSGRHLTARSEARSQLLQTARMAMKAIEDDLRGAFMPSAPYDTGFIGTSTGSVDQPLDTLQFITVNTNTMPRSLKADTAAQPILTPKIDMGQVTYWVEPDPLRPAHGLVRYRQPLLTAVAGTTMKNEDVEEVAPDVVYVKFRYYDTDWEDSWDTTQTAGLPNAVEVTLHVQGEWRGEKYVEKFTSRLYLRVGAEQPKKTTTPK
jgi:prepilin-type N-terminal cleavage/methylation domain-containing protein